MENLGVRRHTEASPLVVPSRFLVGLLPLDSGRVVWELIHYGKWNPPRVRVLSRRHSKSLYNSHSPAITGSAGGRI
jgi:hypothetical protein